MSADARPVMPVIGTVLSATLANTFSVHSAHLLAALAVFLLADFGLDEASFGLLVAACFGTSALSSVVAGRFADRTDPLRNLLVVCFTATTALFLISRARSVTVLVIVLVVVGVANAVAQSAGNVLIHRYVPVESQGASFGLKMGAIPLSGLLSGLLVSAAVWAGDWRRSFEIAALLALFVALGIVRLYRIRASRSRPAPSPRGATTAPWTEATSAASAGRSRDDPRRGLGGSTWLLAAAALCGSTAASTIGAFYVLSAVDHGFGAATSGLLLTAGSISGLTARLGWGHLADRFSWDGLKVSSVLMGVGSVAIAGLTLGSTQPFLFYLSTVVSFATAWGWPGLFIHGIVQRHVDRPGFATGVVQMGIFLGGTLGPPTYGLMATSWGYVRGWYVMAGLLVIATTAVVAGVRTGRSTVLVQ